MKDTKVDVVRRQPHLIARGSDSAIVPSPLPEPIALKPEPRPTCKLDAHELRSLLATQRRTHSISDLHVSMEVVDEPSAPTPATPMPARLAHTLRRARPAPIPVSIAAPGDFDELPLPGVDGTPVIAMTEAAEPVPALVVVDPPPAQLMVAPVAPLPVEPAMLAMGSTMMMVEVFHVPVESVELVIDPPIAPARDSRMHDLLIGLGIGAGVIAGVLVALALI